MKKEATALYILRLILNSALLAFICMIYWSSTLIEGDMKAVKADLNRVKMQIEGLGKEFSVQKPPETAIAEHRHGSHIDPSLPNLLEEDLFYTKTLPDLLPKGFKPHGTFHQAQIGKPDNLHPFSSWANISEWKLMCGISVAALQFGKYETLAPNMAIKMEERNSDKGVPEFWVHLRDDVYWAPLKESFFSEEMNLAGHFLQKHQVTADDFKFWYDATMNPFNHETGAISSRTYLQDIEEIEVIDPFTFVVRWKAVPFKQPDGTEVLKIKYVAKHLTGALEPLASFVYKYFADGSKIIDDDSNKESYRTSSVWAQNFSQHWAKSIIPSCGAWIFDGMNDREIKFRRNPNFFNRYAALAKKSVFSFRNSPDSIWQDFKSGNLDNYILQANQLAEYDDFLDSSQYREQTDRGEEINRLDYLMRAYNFIAWNQATPFFKETKVRQAMTMAIDRQRIIEQSLNGMGVEITGAFFRDNLNAYDRSIEAWPFDPKRARHLLEEAGWADHDGDGILDKVIEGKSVPFTFSLTYYVKNPTTKSVCEYVATALKEIGIICNLNGVDLADLSSQFESKAFDALFLGWVQGAPPPDPWQLWHSSGAKEAGSSNAIGFANAEADSIIETLRFTSNREERKKLYYRFDAIIHEEQPYTFLYSPKTLFLYRDWLKNVFIPADRQDLIPGADVEKPESSAFWLQK